MQVMLLVICSRLLAFYSDVKAVCERGILQSEQGRELAMKKCSHLHHNRTFFSCNNLRRIFLDCCYCFWLRFIRCRQELSLFFSVVGRVVVFLAGGIFCLHFVYSRHKLHIAMYHLVNVRSFYVLRSLSLLDGTWVTADGHIYLVLAFFFSFIPTCKAVLTNVQQIKQFGARSVVEFIKLILNLC